MPDDLNAALDAIRERAAASHADDVPRLLAAVDAALSLADVIAAPHAPARSLYEGGYVDAEQQLGKVIRETISRALLGGDSG